MSRTDWLVRLAEALLKQNPELTLDDAADQISHIKGMGLKPKDVLPLIAEAFPDEHTPEPPTTNGHVKKAVKLPKPPAADRYKPPPWELLPRVNPERRYTYGGHPDGLRVCYVYDTWAEGGPSIVCAVGANTAYAHEIAKLLNADCLLPEALQLGWIHYQRKYATDPEVLERLNGPGI